MDKEQPEGLALQCRLCGESSLKNRNGGILVPKSKYCRDLNIIFSIDVEQDNEFHPQFICISCEKKVVRWRKSKNRKKTLPVNIKIVSWPREEMTQKFDLKELILEAVSKNLSVNKCDDCVQVAKRFDTEKLWELTMSEKGNYSVMFAGIDITHKVHIENLSPQGVLDALLHLKLCPGNQDFNDLCRHRSQDNFCIFKDQRGSIVAKEMNYMGKKTVRHENCDIVCDQKSSKCKVCVIYKKNLGIMQKRANAICAKPVTLSSSVRNNCLSPQQLLEKTKLLKNQNTSLKRKNQSLQEKLSNVLQDGGVDLDAGMHRSLTTVLEQASEHLPEGSIQALLWDHQMKYNGLNDKRQMRWHPRLIKLAIAIQAKSSSAYQILRNSGIALPHENTLHAYKCFDLKPGFSPVILKNSIDNLKEKEDFKKNVSLVWDEMKIKEGLVYSSETGQLLGFVELGDVNHEIQKIDLLVNGKLEPATATHIIAFMVRGLFSSLKEIFGYFLCTGFTSQQLYWTVWRAVRFLESGGLRVRVFVCDGASPNRKFYRIHRTQIDQPNTVVYSTPNRFAPDRRIYFICDPPHLMKTTRNNWENSKFNNQTRHLEFDGQSIAWPQLIQLVQEGMGYRHNDASRVGGIHKTPRVSADHLYLNPSLRMKVKLAVQVLSSRIADAFKSNARLRDVTKSTQKFVIYMDTFFDAMNVSSLNYDKTKPATAPYTSVDDWRLDWLENDFLPFLRNWEQQSASNTALPASQRQKLCLSLQTLEGFRITVKSFVRLCRELLQEPGVKFVLSGKLNQDPLENEFGHHRGSLGRNDNPNALQFRNSLRTLHVGSSMMGIVRGGNCEGFSHDPGEINNRPLPRYR